WMDFAAPVQTLPDGRKYKALFAPLIIDLDNRVNLNVHGNILGKNRGTAPPHVSNQGWGPWTVNLGQVLTLPVTGGQPTEWTNLFRGDQTLIPIVYGRYGIDSPPGTAPVPGKPGDLAMANGLVAHFYAKVDYDGGSDNGTVTTPAFSPFGAGPASVFPS